jgi:hypothetical protein
MMEAPEMVERTCTLNSFTVVKEIKSGGRAQSGTTSFTN